jgi:hypothetical protein
MTTFPITSLFAIPLAIICSILASLLVAPMRHNRLATGVMRPCWNVYVDMAILLKLCRLF